VTVADRESAFSFPIVGRALRLPVSGAAYDAVAATKPMQQTAAVLLNQSARVTFCIGILLALSSCHQRARTEKVDRDAAVEVMVPEQGAYTGAFIDFGEAEEDVTLEGIEDFETMVGKHQAIIASSSFWGEQDFPTRSLKVIWQHRSLPLVFWSPWDRPYTQSTGPDRFNLNSIIAGT